MSWLDRAIAWVAPTWGESRARSRLMARHYEAAAFGRRTSGWNRTSTDANAAAAGATLAVMRAQARDLVRNNPWARRGLRRITSDAVGWGIRPKATGRGAKRVMELWKLWAETTQCDAAGRLNFYGLQQLAMRTIARDGEVLIRRRMRLPVDGLAIPMQLQVLEPDFIDTNKSGILGQEGGPIIQGVELDKLGRRVAYWLFDQHPGSISSPMSGAGGGFSLVSRRIPADGILHVFEQERPGQLRGPSWFASVDVRLHDFDEYEDATLIKQKIASCMAAFVTDLDGSGAALGQPGTDSASGQLTDTFEPGMIIPLPVGKQVTMTNPPQSNDHQSFSASALRGVAAGLGTTYADLTGDYSQANYSSERASRISHRGDVESWQWQMLVPQLCEPVWTWMMAALVLAGEPVEAAPAEWSPPPMPILDPDKEASAYNKMIRNGLMTIPQAIRELGYDPTDQLKEIAKTNETLDDLEIELDCDPRRMTAAGQQQLGSPTGGSAAGGKPGDKPAATKPKPSADPAERAPAPEPSDGAASDDSSEETSVKKSPPAKSPDKGAGEVKVFSYHQPFMKAKEIREGIGLPGDVPDGELFSGEFLAKHGGKGAAADGAASSGGADEGETKPAT